MILFRSWIGGAGREGGWGGGKPRGLSVAPSVPRSFAAWYSYSSPGFLHGSHQCLFSLLHSHRPLKSGMISAMWPQAHEGNPGFFMMVRREMVISQHCCLSQSWCWSFVAELTQLINSCQGSTIPHCGPHSLVTVPPSFRLTSWVKHCTLYSKIGLLFLNLSFCCFTMLRDIFWKLLNVLHLLYALISTAVLIFTIYVFAYPLCQLIIFL